ncbi:MAG TPA: hypothetical protein VIC61_09570 [Gammaproteobacteria bacterium]|jgi:hypothetical protein
MSAATGHLRVAPQQLFQIFKYCVYTLLAVNILLFLREEWLAAGHLFADGAPAAELIAVFAQTIDTAAWVVLLLLFELETFVIPEERIRGRLKLTLHGVRAFCYLFIVYAFWGYLTKYLALLETVPVTVSDPCALVRDASYMVGADVFERITSANCAVLPFAPHMFELTAFDGRIVTDAANLESAQLLALTDVINAGDWLLVVLLLEVDVRLEEAGRLHGAWRRGSQGTKIVLYSVLLGCAIYWWFEGDFLDFWDAFLWLVAFVFIELNLFEWHDPVPSASTG